jgi:hypothetical protein
MSARRAVLLTLVGVMLVTALGVGGFFAYKGYDRYEGALSQAKAAEAKANSADKRAAAADARAASANSKGYAAGEKGALSMTGLASPGWYVVKVAPGETTGIQPWDVMVQSKMAPCKSYWFDSGDDSMWSRPDESNCFSS